LDTEFTYVVDVADVISSAGTEGPACSSKAGSSKDGFDFSFSSIASGFLFVHHSRFTVIMKESTS
jgi:hypothetical protein